MPNPEVVIPQLEGTVGSLAGGKQAISDWVQSCRALMKSGANKSKTTWNFTAMPDIDEAGSVAVGPQVWLHVLRGIYEGDT